MIETTDGAVAKKDDTRIDVGEPQGSQPILILESDDGRDCYLTSCVPLYHAAIKGDWKAAKLIIEKKADIVRFGITADADTTLHIAAAAKQATFVEKLVERMDKHDLALKNRLGNTAFCFAAASGIVRSAKAMYEMNRDLPLIRGHGYRTPLYMAALFGHREMMSYLYKKTDFEALSDKERILLLIVTISADFYDMAFKILKKAPSLALARVPKTDETALHVLARKPSAIWATRSDLGIWKRCVNSCFKGIYHKEFVQTVVYQLVEKLWDEVVKRPDQEISDLIRTPSRLLFDAAALGNVEFFIVLFRKYPDLIWKVEEGNRSLFHVAVVNRQESIFNLIYEIGAIKDLIAAYKDGDSNNMLHLAGNLAPSNRLEIVSGAALQLQRELLWFKAVEKVVSRSYVNMKNSGGKTARDLFSESHKELVKDGEKWMKDTATSSMLVATLIATVVFAAAFTAPGGNNSETGTPIFQREKWFTIFVISDAVALFSSTISIIMFLSILTSRYAEEDFLWSLPSRLMFGLTALFISIATMVLAFSAIFFLAYDHRLKWIPTLIISLGCLLVLLFVLLHYRLWFDTIRSTFFARFLFRPHKLRLYQWKTNNC